MPEIICRLVDIYAYRQTENHTEFLLLKRSGNVLYPDQWRMIGGKILPDEKGLDAALRELREETGQNPIRFWTLPSVNIFYEHSHDRMNLIPAFAAELVSDPVLNHEHDQFAWLGPEQAVSLLAWPEQRRLLNLTNSILVADAIMEEWEIRV